MQSRLEYDKAAPGAMQALLALQKYVEESGLERSLLELIKTRASQINGCAYCIDMHAKDARALGESEQRLYALPAWRETPFYTERERAALAWTEAITLISQGHAPDEVFEQARAQFTEEDLVNLTLAIIAINGWNRLAIGFREVPGTYRGQGGSNKPGRPAVDSRLPRTTI
ncbi:MAG: carboxymuconolactone decarboxylase family protein [Chromatiales bacterium]